MIRWVDESGLTALPVAAYGVMVLLLAAVCSTILHRTGWDGICFDGRSLSRHGLCWIL